MLIFNIIFHFGLICMVYSQEVYLVPANRLVYVIEGSKVRIECINKEGTNYRPIWTKAPASSPVIMAETEYPPGAKIEKAILIHDSFTASDVGTYYCALTPTAPKQSVTLKLIKEFKVGDHFYFGNKTTTLSCNIEVEEGTKVEFKEWSFKHKPGDTRFKFEEGNATITIVKPTREDAGVYSAIFALNTPGFEEHNYTCTVEYTAGPLVLNMKRSQNLNLNEDLHLICEILGYPPAVAKWVRNSNVNLTEDERTEIKPHKGYNGAELVIRSIKYEEAGNYTCIAYSAEFMNYSSKSILVRVKAPCENKWGDKCENTCSENCVNKSCNKDNGSCQCKEGYTGDKCETNMCSSDLLTGVGIGVGGTIGLVLFIVSAFLIFRVQKVRQRKALGDYNLPSRAQHSDYPYELPVSERSAPPTVKREEGVYETINS